MQTMNVEQACGQVLAAQAVNGSELENARQSWQGAPDDGAGFLRHLVAAEVLTPFQWEVLQAGITGPLQLGPYRLYERIAGGRLGQLYRGVHTEFDQPVTIKVFPPALHNNREAAIRMAREARIAAQIDDPHVVRTYHIGRVEDLIFLVFEDLQGGPLADWLKGEAVLQPVAACQIVRDAAAGLQALHDLDVVHRDIQPGNIWVSPDGTGKLMEFGAARDALSELDKEHEDDEAITLQSANMLGTLDYVSPEQVLDEHAADARSDIYALGSVLFRSLAGSAVFPDKNPMRQMMRLSSEAPRRVDDLNVIVSREIADAIDIMLQKSPDKRYQRAADVAAVLEHAIGIENLRDAAARAVSPEFLEWTTDYASADAEIASVSADPEWRGFVHWLEGESEEV
jgi:serine/threonine-protein kinase